MIICFRKAMQSLARLAEPLCYTAAAPWASSTFMAQSRAVTYAAIVRMDTWLPVSLVSCLFAAAFYWPGQLTGDCEHQPDGTDTDPLCTVVLFTR